MSAYSTLLTSLTGLVYATMHDDAAGATTATDIGPNGYTNAAYTAPNVQGPALFAGGGPSASTVGATQWLSKPVVGGGALQITGPFTVGGWFQITNLPATGNRTLTGRNANWRLLLLSSGTIQFSPITAGSAGTRTPGSSFAVSTGTPFFVVGEWTGEEFNLYLNGVLVGTEQRVGGSITPTTDALVVGSNASAGTAIDGYYAGQFVFNRAIGAGAAGRLFRAGSTLGATDEALIYNRAADSVSAAIAAAPVATGCYVCGGDMTANEPNIAVGANAWHPGCYGARAARFPQVFTTGSSTAAQISVEARRVVFDNLGMYLRHQNTTSEKNYMRTDGSIAFNGSDDLSGAISNTVFQSAPEMSYALALLAYLGGARPTSWLVTAAKKSMDYILATQIPAGQTNAGAIIYAQEAGGNAGSFDLAPMAFATHLLANRGLVDRMTVWRWTKALAALGENVWSLQYPWYANGNYKLNEAAGFYAMYRLTGDQLWLTRYTAAKTFADSPPNPVTGYQNNSGLPFGFIQTTVPTQSDGSDGAGYFTETLRNGSTAPMLDWDYLQVQMGALVRLHAWSGDAWALSRLNQLVNTALTRVNTTNWNYDATGGSRHSLVLTLVTSAAAYLIARGYRPDLAAAYPPGAQWNVGADISYSRNGLRTSSNNASYHAAIGLQLAQWMLLDASQFTVPTVGQMV